MRDEVDVDAVADGVLLLDGPYTHETLTDAARLIDELVRRLNHATYGRPAPPTIDRMVSDLSSAAHGLDQLCTQLADRLIEWHDDPRVRADGATTATPQILLHDARAVLKDAAEAAARLGRLIGEARKSTSHLYAEEGDC
jgi:hypothetical protein